MMGYLSVKAMAERTGLSEERIRQLIRTHQIKRAMKLHGWKVKVEDFEAFLRTRMFEPDGSNGANGVDKEEPPPTDLDRTRDS